MKRLTTAALALALLLAASQALAFGFGAWLGFEGGTGEIDPEVGRTYEVAARGWGGGFTFDTNPMTKDFFSYRLNLGVQAVTFEPDRGQAQDGVAYFIDNVFTFTLSSDGTARYWLGPMVRFAGYSFDEEGVETDMSDFGAGLAGGFSYMMYPHLVASPSLGAVYNFLNGTSKGAGGDVDLSGDVITFYARVDFLYDF